MSKWISVNERLPEPETQVLIRATRTFKGYRELKHIVVTTAIYEDGKVSTEDSIWNWYDVEFIHDDENDIDYVPEGWWEYRHYNDDDVYNNAVSDVVTHWMPIPELEGDE